jgi:2-polyprenyl-6-methoxyphenol hydroxylase-like FAD-dependent oxidoreductase
MTTVFTDVLIIGAGPTGMALSIALLQRGVKHVLIDRLREGQQTSRAGVVHAQTLESLAELGVSDRMATLGLKLTNFSIRDRDRALLSLRFDELPSQHPYLLMLPQNITEAVLAARIAELGGKILRGVEAQHIEHDASGARVRVNQDGEEYLIDAKWVVGGDGMHSLVRKSADIAFDGSSYADSFVLADVRLNQAPAPDEVSLFFSPAGLVVVAPLPSGTFRVVATMDEAPEVPGVADIQALLDARGPQKRPTRVLDVVWSSRFRLHHCLARAYRRGRLFLMGDAAHAHSPAGGQGMNTGIVDAILLGKLLADVLSGARPDQDLGMYHDLRRPAAAQVLSLADRLTKMATARSPLRRWLRNTLLWVVDHLPFAKHRIAMSLAGLSRAHLARLPDPDARGGRGETTRRQAALASGAGRASGAEGRTT